MLRSMISLLLVSGSDQIFTTFVPKAPSQKMDRQKQLEQCKICNNKGFDLQKGIVCSLTGDHADYSGSCPHFSEIERRQIPIEEKEDSSFDAIAHLIKRMVRERFIATPVLLTTCVVLYILMAAQSQSLLVPNDFILVKFGANTKPLTIYGDYWRLFTSIFLHGSLYHLATNMLALFTVGLLLERVVGNLRMGLIFIITGIAASAVSVLWNDVNTGVGASGAIFGMFGVYIILLTTNIMDKQSRMIILIFLIAYVAYSILSGLGPGIDVGAHLGGLVSGLMLGLALRPSFIRKQKLLLNTFFFGGAGILIMAMVFLIMIKAPNVENKYYRVLYDFSVEEDKALTMFNKYHYKNLSSSRRMIIGNVVPTFRKCRRLVNEAGDLEGLPEDLVHRSKLLSEYCDYSIRHFEGVVLMKQNGNTKYEFLHNYVAGRVQYLVMRLRDSSYTDSLYTSFPIMDMLRDIPDSVLLVYDGLPILNRSEIQDVDPLDLNSIHFFGASLTTRIYGKPGENGGCFIESREAAKSRVQKMKESSTKDELLQIYGLKKVE